MIATGTNTTTERLRELQRTIESVIRGKSETVQLGITTLLAGGHLLVEDVPGVGKTTLAQTLARCLDGSFQRIQFTSDLLPSDIVGVSVFNQQTGDFEFKSGPIFANIILADEINRTTPKTQSSLLEAMSEGRATIENQTYDLPRPFLVLATQNPLEHHGTYPLPESQLDRFLMRIRMGYPAVDEEKQILRQQANHPTVPFRYSDRGIMATIGRAAAVAEIKSIHLAGFTAWLAWLFIHLLNLIGFRNRLSVLIQWMFNYFTYMRTVRLIVGQSTDVTQGEPRPETQAPETHPALTGRIEEAAKQDEGNQDGQRDELIRQHK